MRSSLFDKQIQNVIQPLRAAIKRNQNLDFPFQNFPFMPTMGERIFSSRNCEEWKGTRRAREAMWKVMKAKSQRNLIIFVLKIHHKTFLWHCSKLEELQKENENSPNKARAWEWMKVERFGITLQDCVNEILSGLLCLSEDWWQIWCVDTKWGKRNWCDERQTPTQF